MRGSLGFVHVLILVLVHSVHDSSCCMTTPILQCTTRLSPSPGLGERECEGEEGRCGVSGRNGFSDDARTEAPSELGVGSGLGAGAQREEDDQLIEHERGVRSIDFCLSCNMCRIPAMLPRGHIAVRSETWVSGRSTAASSQSEPESCEGNSAGNDSRHVRLSLSWYTQRLGTIKGTLCGGTEGWMNEWPPTRNVDEEVWGDVAAACEFKGLRVVEDAVGEEEEADVVSSIDAAGWANSQCSRRKQDYGPKINFKKQTVKAGHPLPMWCLTLLCKCPDDFLPAELGIIEYSSDRGSYLQPHIDDAWLWGERIVTVSLCGDTCMIYSSRDGREVRVSLRRRSVMIISGEARHRWRHEIRACDMPKRRISATFRELSMEFGQGGASEELGKNVIEVHSGALLQAAAQEQQGRKISEVVDCAPRSDVHVA